MTPQPQDVAAWFLYEICRALQSYFIWLRVALVTWCCNMGAFVPRHEFCITSVGDKGCWRVC